jgi:hypothetical protein
MLAKRLARSQSRLCPAHDGNERILLRQPHGITVGRDFATVARFAGFWRSTLWNRATLYVQAWDSPNSPQAMPTQSRSSSDDCIRPLWLVIDGRRLFVLRGHASQLLGQSSLKLGRQP